MPTAPIWIIMPILGARQYTTTAIADCLNQDVPTRLLLINQGVDDDFRAELEGMAEEFSERIFLWSHQPPLPSLSATWNRALDFVWSVGGAEALVVNNDVRIPRMLVRTLCTVRTRSEPTALFVSAVGVTAEQYETTDFTYAETAPFVEHGGPDFSCFLIGRECHEAYRFDEAFIPAYCEDLDYHRRLLLDGEGERIFSINLPYLHYAAGTLKEMGTKARQAVEATISAGSRAHYLRKWGGAVNQERFLAPFNVRESPELVKYSTHVFDETATTPYLQAHPPTKKEPVRVPSA